MKYNVVCPLAEKDVEAYLSTLEWLEKYLDVKNFVVIGNEKVKESLAHKCNEKFKVIHLDESQFITYDQVKSYIAMKSNNDSSSIKRTGWYLQQFLKFSYSLICEDEYYLLWDADTLPTHKHIMMQDNHLIFDMKTEHHDPYFQTFSRLFPLYDKRSSCSYISEHMIIKTSIMREMIDELCACNIEGDSWQEKIINAIDVKDLAKSGFSDYETYGLFCLNKYPDLYTERKWTSLRPASSFFEYDKMRDCDYEWIKKDYDAVSFEANIKAKRYVNILCRSKFIQDHISCKKLLRMLHQFTI